MCTTSFGRSYLRTYFGNEVRSITKIFNKFNVKITFRTKNTIGKLLKPTEETNKYENSRIYKLKRLTCQSLHTGKTDRNFKARYKEHVRKIRYNKPKTDCAQHILNTGHEYGNL
jgi:hypothetical protein